MNATTKKTTIGILTQLRDTKVIGAGVKRSLTATIKKVESDTITSMEGVIAALTATADKPLTVPQDAKILRDTAKLATAGATKARQTAVKATKATAAGSGKGAARKTAVKAVQTGDAGTVTVRTPKFDRDAALAVYQPVTDLLVPNGIGVTFNAVAKEHTAHIRFERDGWVYWVHAPGLGNPNDDDNWYIAYAEGDGPVVHVEDELSDADEVIAWLCNDLGIKKVARKAPTRKAAGSDVAAKPRAPRRTQSYATLSAIVNASRVLMEQARNVAENLDDVDIALLDVFQSVITAQAELRRMIDGDK